MKKIIFFFCCIFITLSYSTGQETLKSIEEEYYDFLSLQGYIQRPSLGYRTLSDSVWKQTENAENINNIWKNNNLGHKNTYYDMNAEDENWFLRGIDKSLGMKIYGPDWFNSFNTALPYGYNDGALWQGRGFNSSLSAGVTTFAFGFEATFKPQITFSQNIPFDFKDGVYGSKFSYFWRGNIDLVQRYGDDAYWQFDWGDSEIRYNYHTFTVGFGSQSPWLGPAWLNSMLGSNNAPSYPKFDFGFKKTSIIIPYFNWYLGEVEARIWIGKLTESDYFDKNDNNNENLLNGFNISYAPSFMKGFTIGATKACISKWGDNFYKYLNPFYSDNNWGAGASGEDQKASIYIDWIFPEVGFETFAELGLDDFSSQIVANPFHTAVYTIGGKKAFNFKNLDFAGELIFEFNNFEMSQDFQLQWNYIGYYGHGLITQGYTQKGQIIGNGISPFGNSQYIGYKLYYPKGYSEFYLLRYSPDMNYVYNKAINYDTPTCEKNFYGWFRTAIGGGIKSSYFITDSFILSAHFNFMDFLFNDYTLHENKMESWFLPNFHFELSAKYNF